MSTPGRRTVPGLAIWLLLLLAPVRHVLEGTMVLHMLVQVPLLALAGWWLGPLVPRRAALALAPWNRAGISGLLLASLVAMVWMLPRALDAALTVSWVEAAKFTSVPLLVGLPLALSWPVAGFVVRGVLLVEATATAFRLGWVYLVSPERLCANYLLGDQQQVGRALLAIGVVLCLFLGWKLVWGHVAVDGGMQPRQALPHDVPGESFR